MASDGRQIIQHQPGLEGNPRTRPLKTGKEFLLVIGQPRVIQLRFDGATYRPGDACQLLLDGSELGTTPLSFIVEAEDPCGAWTTVATLKAEVSADRTQAVARWSFPVPPGWAELVAAQVEAKRGKLLQAGWERDEVTAGEALEVHVTAQGMEDSSLVFLVECEEPDGTWRCVSNWEGVIKEGSCRGEWRTPEAPPDLRLTAAGNLQHCRFEDGVELPAGQTAWLAAHCEGLDGQLVEVILEQEQGEGWVAAGSAIATVKVGRARAGIPLASE